MRSSSAHTSDIRPEITSRPAHERLAPGSNWRTIFKRCTGASGMLFLISFAAASLGVLYERAEAREAMAGLTAGRAWAEAARSRGIALLCWSFDPLQAGNARFNLDKLGATSNRYVIDMYGPRTDALNSGTSTDRLIVEWETQPVDPPHPITDELRIEIPASITDLRQTDPIAAERIQQDVRHSFQEAFAQGYRAQGFQRDNASGTLRCYYQLQRRSISDSPVNW